MPSLSTMGGGAANSDRAVAWEKQGSLFFSELGLLDTIQVDVFGRTVPVHW